VSPVITAYRETYSIILCSLQRRLGLAQKRKQYHITINISHLNNCEIHDESAEVITEMILINTVHINHKLLDNAGSHDMLLIAAIIQGRSFKPGERHSYVRYEKLNKMDALEMYSRSQC